MRLNSKILVCKPIFDLRDGVETFAGARLSTTSIDYIIAGTPFRVLHYGLLSLDGPHTIPVHVVKLDDGASTSAGPELCFLKGVLRELWETPIVFRVSMMTLYFVVYVESRLKGCLRLE